MGVVVVLAVVAVAVVTALAVAVALPWRVSLALSARGAKGGGWALAGGAQLAAVAATYTRGRGVPGAVGVHVLGRRVWPRRGAAERGAAIAAKEEQEEKKKDRSTEDRPSKLGWPRWLDPIDLALFVAGERRRLALRELDGRVRLALADVALAGQLSGLLAIASGLVAPFGRLRHEVDWAGEEALEASVSAQIRFSPGLILWDTALFFIRARREHTRRARASEKRLSVGRVRGESSSEQRSSEAISSERT